MAAGENQIPTHMNEKFQTDVHHAYQRMGSHLRNTVQTENNVNGTKTYFNTIGVGEAVDKPRNGEIPPMNVDRDRIPCDLVDKYARVKVDKQDINKMIMDEKKAQAMVIAGAFGRTTDNFILDAMADPSIPVIGTTAGGMTLDKAMEATETLGDNDVPDDGERYGIVGPREWNQLLKMKEFASADYVGKEDLPFKGKGVTAKMWMGVMWMMFSGVRKVGDVAQCKVYHKSSIGHAIGTEPETEWQWSNGIWGWDLAGSMSMGTCLVDKKGIITIPCDRAA